MPGYPRPAYSIPGLNSGLPPLSEVGAVCSSSCLYGSVRGPLGRAVPTATEEIKADGLPTCGLTPKRGSKREPLASKHPPSARRRWRQALRLTMAALFAEIGRAHV